MFMPNDNSMMVLQIIILMHIHMSFIFVSGQFLQNQCNAGGPNCTPCPERLPSCSGLQDGNNPFPDRPMSGDYIRCFRERTISIEKCTNSVFDPLTRSCRRGVDESNLILIKTAFSV